MTRGQKTAADVTALLRARNTLIHVYTQEELRVQRAIIEAAGAARYDAVIWDVARGLVKSDGKPLDASARDPAQMLDRIRSEKQRRVYILLDFHKWLADPVLLRAMRSLAIDLQGSPSTEARTMIVIAPVREVPPELRGHAQVVEWPLPDKDEIGQVLDEVLASLPPSFAKEVQDGLRDRIIAAAVGLSADGAANCFALSAVTEKKIDPLIVAQAKKRAVEAAGGLQWFDPDPRGLDAVGGLENLKKWLLRRKEGFNPKAAERGLRPPRGMLLVGQSGCGKSLVAKVTATVFGCPLIRMDFGALQSKYVGESQQNIRNNYQLVESLGFVVVWWDEFEKAMRASTGPQGDGGVASDQLGTSLTWMQESKTPAFIIATCNDVRELPPELLRKGRFDEVFFVDLPTTRERIDIARVTLRQYNRDPEKFDLAAVARACDKFNGSEIATVVQEAVFSAFSDGDREVTTEDLLLAAQEVVPLAKTAADKVEALREWAKGRARQASLPEDDDSGRGRALDV